MLLAIALGCSIKVLETIEDFSNKNLKVSLFKSVRFAKSSLYYILKCQQRQKILLF